MSIPYPGNWTPILKNIACCEYSAISTPNHPLIQSSESLNKRNWLKLKLTNRKITNIWYQTQRNERPLSLLYFFLAERAKQVGRFELLEPKEIIKLPFLLLLFCKSNCVGKNRIVAVLGQAWDHFLYWATSEYL